MRDFRELDKNIDRFLIIILVLIIIGFLCSCSSKTTYNIYLEHQPQEPLYTTSSLEDAQDYYNQFKPFHSDMYLIKK